MLEKRFLINFPFYWYGRFKVYKSTSMKIHQTFLAEPDIELSKVRCAISNGSPVYSYWSVKNNLNNSISVIPIKTFHSKLKYAHCAKHRIDKIRYFINSNSSIYLLDVYLNRLFGLVILKVKSNKLLPPHFEVIKEITHDKQYYNSNLAELPSFTTIFANNK